MLTSNKDTQQVFTPLGGGSTGKRQSRVKREGGRGGALGSGSQGIEVAGRRGGKGRALNAWE